MPVYTIDIVSFLAGTVFGVILLVAFLAISNQRRYP